MPVVSWLRQRWWARSHQRFFQSQVDPADDFTLNAGTPAAFDELVSELRAVVDPQSTDVVLDLGGGNGKLSSVLFAGCRMLIVLDLCRPKMIEAPCFVIADMAAPPFAARTFTKVFTYSTLPHVGSTARALKMLSAWDRLLAPGGTLFIGDIPERARAGAAVARGREKPTFMLRLKYYFAIAMITYFPPATLQRHLAALGYNAKVMNQSPRRRFHAERFDIVATKPRTLVEVGCR